MISYRHGCRDHKLQLMRRNFASLASKLIAPIVVCRLICIAVTAAASHSPLVPPGPNPSQQLAPTAGAPQPRHAGRSAALPLLGETTRSHSPEIVAQLQTQEALPQPPGKSGTPSLSARPSGDPPQEIQGVHTSSTNAKYPPVGGERSAIREEQLHAHATS